MDFKAIVSQCEDEIRAGQSQKVAARLSSLERADVPLSFRLPLANLCRRVGLVSQGMKYLAPIVQADREGAKTASAAELAEYAALLQREGALHEALLLLSRVDKIQVPDAFLFKAFCHFARWEYDLAIPVLRDYLASPVAPYAKLVGSVNLASALLATNQLGEATEILSVLIESAHEGKFVRLLANCLEMRAQVRIRTGNFAAAREDLASGTELASREKTIDLFLIQKWASVLSLLESGDSRELESFRSRAHVARDWESIREADLYLLKVGFEPARFEHLYFGTPYSGYRSKIVRELGKKPERDSHLHGTRKGAVVDVDGGLLDGREALKFGGKTHRLLQTLMRDFYRPVSLGGLFAELFPDEYFNVFSSPNRVRQVVSRGRKWFEANGLPVGIDELGGTYALVIRGEVGFEVRIEPTPAHPQVEQVSRLLKAYGPEGGFTTRQGRHSLDLSPTAFKRLMSWAIENGKVERLGATTSTYYRLLRDAG